MDAITFEQLDDLRLAAAAAGDAHALKAIDMAILSKTGIQQDRWILAERDAYWSSVEAWSGRCARTNGHPWMLSADDPKGIRPCPGCRSCRTADITVGGVRRC